MGVRALFEKRDVFTDSPAEAWAKDYPSLFGGPRTFAGKRVTQRSSLQMIAVYQCQSIIIDGIATLPVDHFRKVGDRREEVPADQSPRWIRQPNPFQTPVEFWSRVVQSLLSDGNAFIATIRNKRGAIQALYCLHPGDVHINAGKLGENTYTVNGEQFDRSQILHIPGFVFGNEARGLSPIDIAREAIGLGQTAEEFGARFFSQGVTMSGVIEHPGMPNKDEAKLLREMFRKTHGGVKNSHAVGILTGGASFKPITVTPEQAQFLETRRFQKSEIAGLYRVPAYRVDPSVTSTWGSGIEEQNKSLILDTYLPWAVRIEQAISTFLLAGPQFIKFNFDARQRPTTKERYEAYQKGIDAGFLCLDDVRALEDMPPLPNGQGKHFWRPGNMVPIKQALEKPKETPKPVDPPPAEPADDTKDKPNE